MIPTSTKKAGALAAVSFAAGMGRPPRRLGRTIIGGVALALLGGLLAMAASTRWFLAFGGKLEGARLVRARRSSHFDGSKFVNPIATTLIQPGKTLDMLRHQLFGREERVPQRAIPVVTRTAADYAQPPASGLRATWIGHATTLIEIDGQRVLTDPVWSERASPSTLVGPRRFHAPPLALDELPKVDVVLVSHDHFDHLDMDAVKFLAARGARFVVPLGVGAHLEAWSIPKGLIDELDWGEVAQVAGLEIVATPARHYSGRGPFGRDATLWSSFVAKGPRHRVFFSGDSGYFDGFKAIGAEHGPFDLTLIKIGASDPMWPDVHLSPEQAVVAHQELRGELLLPIHWGTFNLAFHAWNAPADEVLAAAAARKVRLAIPRPGEWVEPTAPPTADAWWR